MPAGNGQHGLALNALLATVSAHTNTFVQMPGTNTLSSNSDLASAPLASDRQQYNHDRRCSEVLTRVGDVCECIP